VLQQQMALVDKIAGHDLNRSSPLAENYRLNPDLFFSRLLLHVAGNDEINNTSAYKNYQWHKNVLQLWADTADEINSGNTDELKDYEKIVSKEDRLSLLHNQSMLTGLTDLEQSLSSDKTYFDIYSKLRLLVADANKAAENVPTVQQLISVIQGANFFFSASGPGRYSNWAYLEGVTPNLS